MREFSQFAATPYSFKGLQGRVTSAGSASAGLLQIWWVDASQPDHLDGRGAAGAAIEKAPEQCRACWIIRPSGWIK